MYGDTLTTIARVKDRLGITTTEFDALLLNLILAVTAHMETKTGRRFTFGTYTNEIHDGSDFYATRRHLLITKNAPIATVTSIEYKAGTNTTPIWTAYDVDDYDVDFDAGIIHGLVLPRGKRNVRITYTAGWNGYSVGINTFWNFNIVPTGLVNGSNRTFTLPENAQEVIVYADGVRVTSANVTFTAGTNSFTLAVGAQPFSSIAVDYREALASSGSDPMLPADLVDVCERAVVSLFKRREAEGRTTESFDSSSVTWTDSIFSDEMMAVVKNYRRGYTI